MDAKFVALNWFATWHVGIRYLPTYGWNLLEQKFQASRIMHQKPDLFYTSFYPFIHLQLHKNTIYIGSTIYR